MAGVGARMTSLAAVWEQIARDKSGSSSKESTKMIQILMVSDGLNYGGTIRGRAVAGFCPIGPGLQGLRKMQQTEKG